MDKKKFNYFDSFIVMADYVMKAAKQLDEIANNFQPDQIDKQVKDMHYIEHSADIAKHDMMNRLSKEFLPPIEREDITAIAQRIDDVTDSIEDVLIRLDIFNVKSLRSDVKTFTKLIVECCESMEAALKEFHSFKKPAALEAKIIELNGLEEEGDALYTGAVRNLFRKSTDPIELMVWSEIYRRLEHCFDACEDVADGIELVIMKNS
ncbi:MAG: DUF47 domain-containing protein [Lachnospiraceae bacterium]